MAVPAERGRCFEIDFLCNEVALYINQEQSLAVSCALRHVILHYLTNVLITMKTVMQQGQGFDE